MVAKGKLVLSLVFLSLVIAIGLFSATKWQKESFQDEGCGHVLPECSCSFPNTGQTGILSSGSCVATQCCLNYGAQSQRALPANQ